MEITPTELPTTGPTEIVMAAVIAVGILAGVIYYYHTRRVLKKVTAKVINKK